MDTYITKPIIMTDILDNTLGREAKREMGMETDLSFHSKRSFHIRVEVV